MSSKVMRYNLKWYEPPYHAVSYRVLVYRFTVKNAILVKCENNYHHLDLG